MTEAEMWGIPGVIRYPQSLDPNAPTDYRALANAYISNMYNERDAKYANVPRNYSHSGGSNVPANQVMKPSINDQIESVLAYMREPYEPSDLNNVQQREYAGTPRYQQWIDQLTTSPREVALGSSSQYPADIRANGVFYR